MMDLPFLLIMLTVSATVQGIRKIGENCYVDCTALYDPVCGSDGRTYNNECELHGYAGCENTPELQKVKDRPCDVGTVVLLATYEWDLRAPKVKLDAKSAITINIIANIGKGSDNLKGKKLWKVGIFGSEWPDGYGDRVGHVEQILTMKQASKNVKKGKALKLKNIRTRFDLSQVGCGAIAYFCVELAKDPESSVEFQLRAGILLDSIVACKEFECQRPDVNVTKAELPPTCFLPCPPPDELGGAVCGNNSVEYDSFCELTKAARCEGVAVKIDYLGECLPEVIVSGVFWSAGARTNQEDPSQTLLTIELFLFNDNRGVNIAGTDLWQVDLFGSTNTDGTGVRHAMAEQVLTRELSGSPLIGGLPFSLDFTVPYDTYAVGCGDIRFFCLEIKRHPDASVDFILKRTSQEKSIISCRDVPCLERSDKIPLIFRQVRWHVQAELLRIDEPSNINLNISVEVLDNSAEIIGGRNLWRIGIYGSRDPTGSENEKLNFIPQVLGESDSLYSPDIIPGQEMLFPLISTQFDLSGVGCGEYKYLCVILAKSPGAEPDFEIANHENKRKVVSCRQVQCIDRVQLPTPPPTALLSYLTWNLTIHYVREDGAYNIRLAVDVVPDTDTDTIRGTDLWRVGIFLSNATGGVMARSQYQPDILTEEDKSIPLINGQHLLFINLEAVLNIEGVGCPGASLQYACLEFAKGAMPEPYFHLPLGASNSAHSCRQLYCHQTP